MALLVSAPTAFAQNERQPFPGHQEEESWSQENINRQDIREEMQQVRKEHEDLEEEHDRVAHECANQKSDGCEQKRQALKERREKLHERVHDLHQKMQMAGQEHTSQPPQHGNDKSRSEERDHQPPITTR